MKSKVKIVYSLYYFKEVVEPMLKLAQKELNVSEDDTIAVPGSYDIPFEIARSIKEDTTHIKENISSFKGKGEKEIRDNIVQIEKLSQLNLNNKCIYSGFLALGSIIKGKTINHEVISNSIFTNLQKISVENILPIGNGIFNANNIKEAKGKNLKCTEQAIKALISGMTAQGNF